MGKKNRIAAAAAAATASRNNRLIENLKTVNTHLAMDAAASRRLIEQLSSHLTSMAAEHEIFRGTERDVLGLALSSSLKQAAARAKEEMALAIEKERILIKKTESVVAELNDAEMEVLCMIKDKDEKKKELEELQESLQSMEQANERGNQRWQKWVCCAAAITLMAISALSLLTFCRWFAR